jgi:hypothetical protein
MLLHFVVHIKTHLRLNITVSSGVRVFLRCFVWFCYRCYFYVPQESVGSQYPSVCHFICTLYKNISNCM